MLPFTTSEPDIASLAQGLTLSVTSVLANVSDLAVIANGSSMTPVPKETNEAGTCSTLGVTYLVKGSLYRSGPDLQLLAELVFCKGSRSVWSSHFKIPVGSLPPLVIGEPRPMVFAVIGNSIITQLRSHYAREFEGQNLTDTPTATLKYRARILMNRHRKEYMPEARELIDATLAREPNNSDSHCLLGIWYYRMCFRDWSTNQQADRDAFDESLYRALKLNPMNHEALAFSALSRILNYRNFDGALTMLERALIAGEHYPKTWEISCIIHAWLGDGQTAVAHGEHALRLAPLHPWVWQVHSALCRAYYTVGQYDAAVLMAFQSHAGCPRPGECLLFGLAAAAAGGRLDDAARLLDLLKIDYPSIDTDAFAKEYPYREAGLRDQLATHLKLAMRATEAARAH